MKDNNTPGMHTLTVTTKWGQILRFERASFVEIVELADSWIDCAGYKIVSPSGADMIDHIVLESVREPVRIMPVRSSRII